MNLSRSAAERVKWILDATTGSSQPLMMFQIPSVRNKIDGGTLKHPRRFMDETDAERFGIVSLEGFDEELDGSVVHVTQLLSVMFEGRCTVNPVISKTTHAVSTFPFSMSRAVSISHTVNRSMASGC